MFASLKISTQGTGTQGGVSSLTTAEVARDARQVSFNPVDNAVLCLTGDMTFKLLRYAEGALKTFGYARTELGNYLSHSWISEEKVVLGTSDGRLQLFEGSDLKWDFTIREDEKSEVVQTHTDGK